MLIGIVHDCEYRQLPEEAPQADLCPVFVAKDQPGREEFSRLFFDSDHCRLGISVGLYPYIIPNRVTIRNASVSSPGTLIFILAMIVILLPVIMVYIGYKHLIFHGIVGIGGYWD